MDFAAIQTALVALLASLLTDVPGVQVLWENEPRKNATTFVLLSWVSGGGVGVDETRWDEDPDAAAPDPNMTPEIVGWRRLVLQVGCERLADQRPAVHARTLVEKLRTRLRRESAQAQLEAANLGLAGLGDATTADYEADDHLVSRCVLELTLNASSFDRSESDAVSSIEHVEVNSTLKDAGGTALPAGEQITGVLP